MKNYFSFTLTGKKLLPIWILYLVLVIGPYIALVLQMKNIQPNSRSLLVFYPLLILLVIVAFAILFFIVKLIIENVSFKGESITFNGTFGTFVGKVLVGYLLSIITLGVYLAWFIRDVMRFFIDNSTYDSTAFKFQGKADKLFLILFLTVFVPMVLIFVVSLIFLIGNSGVIPQTGMIIIQQLIMMLIMIPYIYLLYKWMINIDYKGYTMSWKTNFWNSIGKIAIEMILTLVTAGIYWPLAMVRLYKYFTEKTFADSIERTLHFGYDIDQWNDFLFIWGQTLLTMITLGIYYPWALSKVGSRILGKTYLSE